MPTPRTIREDHAFTQAASQIESNAQRWDEIMEGVIWILARDAFDEITAPVSKADPNLRMIFTAPFLPRTPALRILYRVEGVHVTLLAVGIVEDVKEPDLLD